MAYVSATHHMESLTVEYVSDDGTRYLRIGGNICWRFFNQGNIRPSKTSVCNNLKIGIGETKSGEFMIFPDEETGWMALKLLLTLTHKNLMIKQLAGVYAPAKDKNDPGKYTSFIIHESGVCGDKYVKDLNSDELDKVMNAIKKMEGYYNNKETQKEKIIPTTNITITDGNKPIVDEKIKVIIDQCTYEWSTNQYGMLPSIAHLSERNEIKIVGTGPDGSEDVIYSTTAGTISQNVLIIKDFQIFTAKTKEHKPEDKITEVYIVKKGDTLNKIARRLHTTVKRLADLNAISDINLISVGQEIKVPGGTSKPQVAQQQLSQKSQQQVPTGTSDNGYPQANVGNRTTLAPWMKVAEEQARLWAGKDEYEITHTINYHQKVGVSLPSIAGDSNPWCASFVNYCLIKSNPKYSKSNKPGQAVSFRDDTNHFIRIDTPIYGAIAVFQRAGGGHVCFVVARSDTTNGNIIVLGGNQGDRITFVDRSLRNLIGFFVPKEYETTAKDEIRLNALKKDNAVNLNASLNIDTSGNGGEV